MTPRLVFLAAAAIVATAASAPAVLAQSTGDRPPQPPASPATKDVDPIGTYELSVVVQGNAMAAIAKIEKKPDGTLGGSITTDAYGTVAIVGVKVTGKTIALAVTSSDGSPVSVTLTLEGDQVTGEWAMAGDGSKVTGKKLP